MSWLSVKEAAESLGLSANSVYDLIAAGMLPCRRLGVKGGKIVIDKADVESYWESCKSQAKVTKEPKGALKHLRRPSLSRRPS